MIGRIKMKKILSVILAMGLAAGVLAACDSGSGGASGGTASGGLADAEVWGAPATEKVLQDVHGIYDSFKTEARINVTAAKGEYESQHIIITADEKDLVYDVQISALASADGKSFPVSNIDVFHEKYIEVRSNFEGNGMPVGMYPDALLPFETAKEYGENVVKAGENQGIYFRFNVDIEQEAGTYTGSFRLSIGGESMNIPVTLTVADLEVSETNHAKSIFLNQWSFYKGELDSSQAMLNKYTEALFEYRLNPDVIVTDTNHKDEDIEYYTELAYQYMQNPRCANITIPYETTSVDGQQCIDPVIFDKYLTAFAEKSFETGFNMLEKSVCYIGLIDEPDINGLLDRTAVVTRVYDEQIKETADRLEADNSITASNKAEVIASLRDVRNVVTCAYSDAYAPYVETWCPQYQHYDSEAQRANYADQEEKWWYGCISPRAPYPTYHMEDTLLSARALGWMMAEYDVVGNLFWATDIYAAYNGSKYEEIEDYYGGSASRFPNVNGDGYLFYPGKQYGIDGPVGSLRLEAIRDGLEEYELLYAMKQTYGDVSDRISADDSSLAFTADRMMESLTELVYDGTRVSTTSANFQSSRDALLQLATLSQSEAEFCVIDYGDDGYGTKNYRFYAADGAVVKNNGTEIASSQNVEGGKIYTLDIPLENAQNMLAISVEVGGNTYYYEQNLGGKVSANLADSTTASEFTGSGVTPVYSLVDASSVDSALTGKFVKLDVPSAASDVAQSFSVSGSLLTGVDETASSVIFHIYYDGEDAPAFMIAAKHENQRVLVEMANVTLQKGMNTISVSLTSKSWGTLGAIEYVNFYLGGVTGEPARIIYIADTVVYAK